MKGTKEREVLKSQSPSSKQVRQAAGEVVGDAWRLAWKVFIAVAVVTLGVLLPIGVVIWILGEVLG